MVDVRRDYERFRAAGGGVAVITMGSPSQVAAFRQRFDLPFPCLSDQRQEAYRALGVPRARLAQVAGPEIWWSGLRALVRGGLGIPRGDPYQLHGAFLVDTDGILRFAHRPRNSSDYPDHEAMLAALRG